VYCDIFFNIVIDLSNYSTLGFRGYLYREVTFHLYRGVVGKVGILKTNFLLIRNKL